MPLLKLNHLTKKFGRLVALSEIDLSIEEGEKIGLVGPNGSGKSTLFNLVSGFYNPTQGEISYKGELINGLRPDQIAALGLIRIFQSNILYKEATVLDNILMGCYLDICTNWWQAFWCTQRYRREEKQLRDRVELILRDWDLADVQEEIAEELPLGFQRRLAIAIAVAARPQLLLLDEPVAGMSAEEMEFVIKKTKDLAASGVTIILVEHHVKTVINFCNRLVVLNYGVKIADGPPKEVICQPDVVDAYIGTEDKDKEEECF